MENKTVKLTYKINDYHHNNHKNDIIIYIHKNKKYKNKILITNKQIH